jgi:hypothetical protein
MKLIYISLILSILIVGGYAQVFGFPGSPPNITAYVSETQLLTLVGNNNSGNGAAWVVSFVLDAGSPHKPSWLSNNMFDLTFNPLTVAQSGSYTIHYLVTESGIYPCIHAPHVRIFDVSVVKRSPIVNYNIPDYNSLRAGVAFEINFPQNPWTDPLGETLSYNMIDDGDTALPDYFNLNMANNSLYGIVPTSKHGTITIKMICTDSQSQFAEQQFVLTFMRNNNPTRLVTDLSSYAITLGQGMSSENLLPSNIFIDQDGDNIFYNVWYFHDLESLSSWIVFTPGYQATSKLSVTNAQTTTKTGFRIFLSDNIGTAGNSFLLPFTVNLSPVLSQSSVTQQIYPNDTFTWNVDLSTYITDPESNSLTFTFSGMPSGFTTTLISGTTYKIQSSFPVSAADINFNIIANDGISAPATLPIIIQIASCASECTKCFGTLSSECYACSGVNFLDGTTCGSPCPNAKYGLNGVCQDCHSYCSLCTGAGAASCQECNLGWFLKGSTCVDDCGHGMFGFEKECFNCATGCKTCTGELVAECQVCLSNYHSTLGGTWIEVICLDDEYADAGTCHKCNVSCNKCTQSTNANCINCARGYMLSGGVWVRYFLESSSNFSLIFYETSKNSLITTLL